MVKWREEDYTSHSQNRLDRNDSNMLGEGEESSYQVVDSQDRIDTIGES
jgi:hypothetical protein